MSKQYDRDDEDDDSADDYRLAVSWGCDFNFKMQLIASLSPLFTPLYLQKLRHGEAVHLQQQCLTLHACASSQPCIWALFVSVRTEAVHYVIVQRGNCDGRTGSDIC